MYVQRPDGKRPRVHDVSKVARQPESKDDRNSLHFAVFDLLETDEGAQTLQPGMCAGFAAGGGNAHRLVNKTDKDVLLLIVGDRTPFDEVTYPDIDNHAKAGADGKYVHTKKDGSPH